MRDVGPEEQVIHHSESSSASEMTAGDLRRRRAVYAPDLRGVNRAE